MTPPSVKAQAVLALIGSSPSLRRPKSWVQDKLWSGSDSKRGAASLRQIVHRMRESLPTETPWITSTPGWLGLDARGVRVVLEPDRDAWAATGEPPEFCEGLDVADAEFEDWIRDQRMAFEDRLGAMPPPQSSAYLPATAPPRHDEDVVLHVSAAGGGSPEVIALARVLAAEVAAAVGRLGGVRISEGSGEEDVRLEIEGCRLGGRIRLQATLGDAGALAWSKGQTFPEGGGGANAAFGSFVSEITAATVHLLGRGGNGAAASGIRAGYRAIEDLFALDHASLARCEAVFAAAAEGPAAPVHLAWRAQLRVISVIERMAADPAQTGAEAREMIARSLREAPHNALINAIAADVAIYFEGNPAKADHYARMAVERDPFSPYCRASLAQTRAWQGKAAEAYAEAKRALRLAAFLPNQSWWLMRCCVTAVRCGRYAEAIRYAQTAHELAPQFKPPLRFLAALRFHAGDEAGAAEALARLKTLEPDFSLELMRSAEYPVTSLRHTPLIAVTGSALL